MKITLIVFLLTFFLQASDVTRLCFVPESNSSDAWCDATVSIDQNGELNTTVTRIQSSIRNQLNNDQQNRLILIAKGFMGTLVSIAQTNLLPYYRQRIHGLVLHDAPANLYRSCYVEKDREHNPTCQQLQTFQRSLNGLASGIEVCKALSPTLQMDWYWPKTLLVGKSVENKVWLEGLAQNQIEYATIKTLTEKALAQHFTVVKSSKIQPKNPQEIPNYHAPTLRYHLYKISYTPKDTILTQQEIAYGEDHEQRYDLFYQKGSTDNPLLIYVHGGGWSVGDKRSFHNLCRQYADRGYTAVTLNYRLMRHPKVDMEAMVDDVRRAILHIQERAKAYHADANQTVVMAESAGAQLAFMALTRLPQRGIKAALWNSLTTNLHRHPKAKQIRLSHINEDAERHAWLDRYSPLKQINRYAVPTWGVHSVDDRVVPPEHLESLSIQSVIYHDNIETLWVKNGVHPIAPKEQALQPCYADIETAGDSFLKKMLETHNQQ